MTAAADAALCIRGAEVIDGSGAPRFAADVVVRGGVVDAVLPPGHGRAARVVDGGGLVLCPGFIDAHSHDDRLLLQPGVPNPKLMQGVCTVVTGNCGIGVAPLHRSAPPPPLDLFGAEPPLFDAFGDYLAALDAAALAVNAVPLLGHTNLRLVHVADLGRPATAAETQAMRRDTATALGQGAFGLSTGVYYPPARAADTAELIGVAQALAAVHGVLAMHIRDEGDGVEAAVDEALAVGAACAARLVLSHHKVVGAANHGRTRQTLAAIDAAARRQSVCLDCYPYDASSTMLDAAKAARTARVLITGSQPHPAQAGRWLADIAAGWGLDAAAAAQRLMPGGAIYFGLSGDDVDRVLRHPLTMVGSDGLPHDPWPHPRLWGTFPRLLARARGAAALMPLETVVHKMTGLPARRFGLAGRGHVAAGGAADLVLFDPGRVADAATYGQPTLPPVGIEAVIVNGRLALWRGAATGERAGRRLLPR